VRLPTSFGGAYNGRVSEQADNADVLPAPMRVGWVAGSDTLLQLGRILQPLVIGLMDELIEVVALCPDGASGTEELPTPPVERVVYAPLRWWENHHKAVGGIAERFSKDKIDLLHALDSSSVRLTAHLARSLDVNYVVSSYGFRDGRRIGRLDSHAAAALAACEGIRRDLLAHHVATEEKVLLVRPGVYQVNQPTCFTHPDHSTAIVVGGCGESLGAFESALQSLGELHRRGYDCVYFIVGAGSLERRLRRLAEKLGLRQELTFVDHQSPRQLVGVFKAADIYIAPEPGKWMDVRPLLAMAAGIPVVTCLESEDFIIDGQTAIRFRRDDAADLTTKLLGLMEDPESGRQLVRSSLAYLGENHRPGDMLVAITDVYRQAIADLGLRISD